ncbi:HlyD family secretion protein [Minicystis rosea]|nr:HlyD family secretion protein [Minicystis rosea]
MRAPRKLGAFILALAAATSACAKKREPTATVTVGRGPLVAVQSFYGELVPKKSVPINVPKVPRVDILTVKTVLADGTPVKKGDVIATLDTSDLEENLRSAMTDLAVAEADRRKADQALITERIGLELEQKRRQMAVEEAKLRLVEGVNLISELERKKAEVQLRSAEIELKLATGALDAFAKKRKTTLEVADIKVKTAEDVVSDNRTALERLSIKAPADGVVYRPYVPLNYTRAKAEPGRVCRAGDKLLELPDLSAFEAVLWVRPRDAARIQVGDAARVIIVSLGERMIPAKVAKKDGFATTRNERYGTKTPEGNLKEISITLELSEQPEGMKPGGTVRAEIDSVLKSDAVLLPLWALSDERDGKGFVTLASGERRPVEIGLGSATHGEVLKGLSGGEVLQIGESTPEGSKTRAPVSR